MPTGIGFMLEAMLIGIVFMLAGPQHSVITRERLWFQDHWRLLCRAVQPGLPGLFQQSGELIGVLLVEARHLA